MLARINSQLELDSYLRKLEKITGFEADSIRKLVEDYRLHQNDSQFIGKRMREFHPERKALERLVTAERELLYQMMGHELAIAYYEQRIGVFYDDIYRKIANYLIAYNEKYHNLDLSGLLLEIETSDEEEKDEIVEEVTDIAEEDFHPVDCTDDLLVNICETIEEEKRRINEEDTLNDSLEGKDELEKARIIADFNRRKAMKK